MWVLINNSNCKRLKINVNWNRENGFKLQICQQKKKHLKSTTMMWVQACMHHTQKAGDLDQQHIDLGRDMIQLKISASSMRQNVREMFDCNGHTQPQVQFLSREQGRSDRRGMSV